MFFLAEALPERMPIKRVVSGQSGRSVLIAPVAKTLSCDEARLVRTCVGFAAASHQNAHKSGRQQPSAGDECFAGVVVVTAPAPRWACPLRRPEDAAGRAGAAVPQFTPDGYGRPSGSTARPRAARQAAQSGPSEVSHHQRAICSQDPNCGPPPGRLDLPADDLESPHACESPRPTMRPRDCRGGRRAERSATGSSGRARGTSSLRRGNRSRPSPASAPGRLAPATDRSSPE